MIVSLIMLVSTASAAAQTSLKSGPTVNGISLGATRGQVIKKFGKPISETKRKADECVGGTEMTLRYPGLKFLLWDDSEDPKKFTVGMFEITSAKWESSGARVGQTSTAIKKRFGTRSSEEKEAGTDLTVWYYEMDENISPGNTNFYFRGDKVTKIMSLWMMC